jgi:hypothetical protein
VKSRWLDVGTSEGLRRDAVITVILSVLLLGLGVWNLWDGNTFSGIGCIFGATVFLCLVYRNFRISQERGWFQAGDSDGGDVTGTED